MKHNEEKESKLEHDNTGKSGLLEKTSKNASKIVEKVNFEIKKDKALDHMNEKKKEDYYETRSRLASKYIPNITTNWCNFG